MLRRSARFGLGISFLILVVAAPARGDSVSLKLGEIKGESTAARHEGEIDILSWSWGASNPRAIAPRTGMSAGRVSITDLTLMKVADSATPKLFELVATGAHVPKAVLTVRKGGGDQFEYVRITLEDVIVSALQLSGAGERPSESVSLSFGKVTVEYRPQLATGAPADWISASWNVRTATP